MLPKLYTVFDVPNWLGKTIFTFYFLHWSLLTPFPRAKALTFQSHESNKDHWVIYIMSEATLSWSKPSHLVNPAEGEKLDSSADSVIASITFRDLDGEIPSVTIEDTRRSNVTKTGEWVMWSWIRAKASIAQYMRKTFLMEPHTYVPIEGKFSSSWFPLQRSKHPHPVQSRLIYFTARKLFLGLIFSISWSRAKYLLDLFPILYVLDFSFSKRAVWQVDFPLHHLYLKKAFVSSLQLLSKGSVYWWLVELVFYRSWKTKGLWSRVHCFCFLAWIMSI